MNDVWQGCWGSATSDQTCWLEGLKVCWQKARSMQNLGTWTFRLQLICRSECWSVVLLYSWTNNKQRTRCGVRRCVTQTSKCVKDLQGITSMQSRKHILTSDCEQTDVLTQGNQAGRSWVLSGCCCCSYEKACTLSTSGQTAKMHWWASSAKASTR